MGSQKVKMNIHAYRGDDEIELGLPDNWNITECRMAGHDKPSLSDDEMRSALQSPIGTPRLSEMAKGAKQVCILFDDIPKPTPSSRIMPFVLEELHAGGLGQRRGHPAQRSRPGVLIPNPFRDRQRLLRHTHVGGVGLGLDLSAQCGLLFPGLPLANE